jgi:signal transduction histidine kinase
VKLLDRHAPEDPILMAIELPRPVEIAVLAIAASVIAIAVTGTLLVQDGDDRINLLATALVAVPVVLWIGHGWRCPPIAVTAPRMLVPAALLSVVDVANGDRTLGFAPQFLLYLCLLTLVGCVIAPRRHATLVVAATYAVFVVRGLVSPEPVVPLAPWILALSFCVAGVAGIRVGAVGIARSQQAAAEKEAIDERRQVARDVQDVVVHTLAATMLHVTAARMAVDRSAFAHAIEALEEAERHGRAGLGDIRRIIRMLRSDGDTPIDVAQPGLADLPELVERYEAVGLPVTLSVDGALDRASAAAGLAIYRIAQEALANAARHGTGDTMIDLSVDETSVALSVANPAGVATAADAHGTGLLSMREHTAAAGGTLVVGLHNGDWVVDVCLPNGLMPLAEGHDAAVMP